MWVTISVKLWLTFWISTSILYFAIVFTYTFFLFLCCTLLISIFVRVLSDFLHIATFCRSQKLRSEMTAWITAVVFLRQIGNAVCNRKRLYAVIHFDFRLNIQQQNFVLHMLIDILVCNEINFVSTIASKITWNKLYSVHTRII